MSNSAKNNILNKIKMALATPTPLPFAETNHAGPFVQPQTQDPVVEFAEQFTALQGKFLYCADRSELVQSLSMLFQQNNWTKIYCTEDEWLPLVSSELLFDDISNCDASVTGCEHLLARTGGIVLSSAKNGRIPSVYAPVHICIATTSQLVYDIEDALEEMKARYGTNLPSMISFATGPSRTADIEKTLIVGVHGPKEVYCFVVEDN